MKKILLISLFSLNAFASEGEVSETFARTKRGDIGITGSGGVGYSTYGIGFSGSAEVGGLYYLMENFALGLETSLSYNSGQNRFWGIAGPAVQYHFLNTTRLSFYGKVSYLTDVGQLLRYNYLRTEVGMDYYLTKVFSIGPFVRVTNHFGDGSIYTTSSVGGRIGFHF